MQGIDSRFGSYSREASGQAANIRYVFQYRAKIIRYLPGRQIPNVTDLSLPLTSMWRR